jgi:hypothetical protein
VGGVPVAPCCTIRAMFQLRVPEVAALFIIDDDTPFKLVELPVRCPSGNINGIPATQLSNEVAACD